MEWVPPKAARRLLFDPVVVLIGLAGLVAALPILLLTALVDLVLWKPLSTTRLVAVGLTHVVFEALGVVSLFGLWLASAFLGTVRSPAAQELHHRFMRWWLAKLIGITGSLIGIVVQIEDRKPPRPGPVLVFSRHAGPWDSFLLAHALVHDYHRHPRLVMKAAMQWFPTIDIACNRLPNRFVRPRGSGAASFIPKIEELARGMGDRDAFVIFPEGGNFTQRRRLAAIERLVQEGHLEHADEARGLAHLIAPRPGGVMAAMRGAPDADVVFVAHTGLEPLASLAELWRRVPLRTALLGRYWRMPSSDVPKGEQERVDWLFAWWERIDTWIDEHQAPHNVRSGSSGHEEGIMEEEKPWLAHYPASVPPTVGPIPEGNAFEILASATRRHPDRPAIAWFGRHFSYLEVTRETERFAAVLARLGVRRGDRVALILPNCPQYVIAYYATLRLGAIVVGNNPLYTERELSHQLSDAGATVAVVLDALYPTSVQPLNAVGLGAVVVTGITDYMGFPKKQLAPIKLRREAKTQGKPWPPVPRDAAVRWWRDEMRGVDAVPPVAEVDAVNEPASLVYTGGTTGLSKGAMLTHRNLVANAMQSDAWFLDTRDGMEAIMCVLPFFHCYGMTVGMNLGILKAAKLVLVPRFDLRAIMKEIRHERPTLFPGSRRSTC